MRVVTDFNDYELIDASDGERLERWGKYILFNAMNNSVENVQNFTYSAT